MPSTPWIPTVTVLTDGESVSAETINPVLAQHTQREQHLFEKFAEISGKSALVAYDLPILASPGTIKNYSLVFYTTAVVNGTTQEGLDLATVKFVAGGNNSSAYTPDSSCYTIGVVSSISADNTTADVFLMGLIELDSNIDDPVNGLIRPSECNPNAPFTPGPYFLAQQEAGKITASPGGIAIYIGYALNRTEFLLAPHVPEFSQFFTTYKFNILDRPAGIPVLTNGIWSITNVPTSLPFVGWVPTSSLPSSYAAYTPTGASFFYNLPDATLINADTGISTADRLEQTTLSQTLPPNPPNLSLLTVNGLLLAPQDSTNPDGEYVINELGIWWLPNTDGNQPWSSDIPANETITVDTTTNEVNLPNHGLSLGDVVRFQSTGTLPSAISANTDYYVININVDGVHFQVSSVLGDSSHTIAFTDTGTGTLSIPQPYIWKSFNGTDSYRPRMMLQFLKFNPALKEAVVTSISKYNSASSAIRFYSKSGIEASVGDLFARLLINFIADTPATTAGTAITSLSYNESTGNITYVNAPIVSNLIAGNGITVNPTVIGGVTQPGSFTISSGQLAITGLIDDIEPDGATLQYIGLHSYLTMSLPSVIPSSFIGKVMLPKGIPALDMAFNMFVIGTRSLSNGSTTNNVTFDFSYSVTKNGAILSTGVTTIPLSFNFTVPYTANTCVNLGSLISTAMVVPSSALIVNGVSGDVIVNFSLARTTPVSNAYPFDIGIVDLYWSIG